MLANLLSSTLEAETTIFIAIGVVVLAFILFIISIKVFWISRIFALAFLGLVGFLSIGGLLSTEDAQGMEILVGIATGFSFLYLGGPATFETETETESYVVFGWFYDSVYSEDVRHPVKSFFVAIFSSAIIGALIGWLCTFSFYVGAVWAGIGLILLISSIVAWFGDR